MAGPRPAIAGASWDGRFRRPYDLPALPGETIGALGAEARGFRDRSGPPAVVLETLPAYRSKAGLLVAVPALSWPDTETMLLRSLLFHPPRPALAAPFRAISVETFGT
jgi:hypothetical protein